MNKKIAATLILVLGPLGSGKGTFSKCFKSSFLRTFPMLSLQEGIKRKKSFCYQSDLSDDGDFVLIKKARDQGFKIVCYCLFAARLVCQERNRFKWLSKGELWKGSGFREDYENFYDRMLDVYPSLDMVFFVENQKYFHFVGVYNSVSTPSSLFEKKLRKEKGSCDRIVKT